MRLLRETLLEAEVDFLSELVTFVVRRSLDSSTMRLVVPQVLLLCPLCVVELFELRWSLG